jgi:peptidoglycan/xylan/chitin deacetylase (PgdA/CDA1 family)
MLPHHDRYDYSPIVARPDYSWPGGKRLAVYIALNIEHFAYAKGLGHIPVATRIDPAPDNRSYAWREYGMRVGIWRLFDILDEHGLPCAHLTNSIVGELYPDVVAKVRSRTGDEIIGHGRTNAERQGVLWEKDEAALIREATEGLERSFGTRPYGWMGPWRSESFLTPDLLKEAGYTYFMDWPCDDQPIWFRTRSGKMLLVPYPVEINDNPAMFGNQHSASTFTEMICEQFDQMLIDSEKQPLVFALSIHTFVVGQPFRVYQLRKAFDYIVNHPKADQVWFTVPGEIARHAASLPAGTVPGS